MQDSRYHLLQSLIRNLRGLYSDLYRARPAGDRLTFAGKSVSRAQADLLFFVARHKDGVSVKNAAANLHITSGAITQLSDPLVALGLLVRSEDPNDRRVILLKIATNVDADCMDFEAYYTRHVSPMFDNLSDEEVEQLIHLINKITPANTKGAK